MTKYKIEITKTYAIDVLAKEEAEAIVMADDILATLMANGTAHYNESRDPSYTSYDITNTDDPFNPEN